LLETLAQYAINSCALGVIAISLTLITKLLEKVLNQNAKKRKTK
jgi:hypothetical protein